jgi:hypothetical protein
MRPSSLYTARPDAQGNPPEILKTYLGLCWCSEDEASLAKLDRERETPRGRCREGPSVCPLPVHNVTQNIGEYLPSSSLPTQELPSQFGRDKQKSPLMLLANGECKETVHCLFFRLRGESGTGHARMGISIYCAKQAQKAVRKFTFELSLARRTLCAASGRWPSGLS